MIKVLFRSITFPEILIVSIKLFSSKVHSPKIFSGMSSKSVINSEPRLSEKIINGLVFKK